ncbi:MAG: transposase [Saprospiraceae bacterium]|nr:transposase [Saprospiraceae bacterium]
MSSASHDSRVTQLGQNLSLHPHLHCIIPSGVFDNKQGKWLTLEILAYCVRLKN